MQHNRLVHDGDNYFSFFKVSYELGRINMAKDTKTVTQCYICCLGRKSNNDYIRTSNNCFLVQ